MRELNLREVRELLILDMQSMITGWDKKSCYGFFRVWNGGNQEYYQKKVDELNAQIEKFKKQRGIDEDYIIDILNEPLPDFITRNIAHKMMDIAKLKEKISSDSSIKTKEDTIREAENILKSHSKK